MIRWSRVCATLILLLAVVSSAWGAGAAPTHASSLPAAPRPKKPTLATLILRVLPGQIKVGRDVVLTVQVTDSTRKPVAGAVVSVTGITRPVIGTTVRGAVTLTVHAAALGTALVQASHTGYVAATLKVPIVPGPPATVTAVKVGLSVQAPKARPVPGKAGTDLMALYHALTGKKQFASLALRDGTLVDLDSNTDVVIKDPLHMTLSGGELFLEVVHGAASHQVQVGTVVAATKGTRLDVRVDPKTKVAVVTVIEGKVQVSNKGKSVLVGAGQQSMVLPNKPPNPPQPVNLNSTIAWIANLPNTTPTTVPPVLNLPQPPPVQPALPPIGQQATVTATDPLLALPPIGQQATMTATDPLQTTWSGVVLVPSSATLAAGATLTIQPGTVVEMDSGVSLDIQGTLIANGSSTAPIIFTSTSSTPKPGDWQYITFDGTGSSGSTLSYARVFYGSWNGGEDGMISVTGGAKPSISNSVFAQATNYGVWTDDTSLPTISNCVFAGDATAAISVSGNAAGLVSGTRLGPNQAGIEVRTTTISQDTTWHQQDAPFVLEGGTLAKNFTLTIAPGTVIRMASGATYDVQGTLLARGTASAPIIITSNAANPAPGDWQYITIDGLGATASALAHVQAFYGSWNGGDDGMLSITGGAKPSISNSVFAQATNHGVWADDDSLPTISNCVFAGDATAGISVSGEAAGLVSGTRLGPNQAGIEVRSTTISQDTTWHQQDAPFVLDGGTLGKGSTLTILPGTVIRMASGATYDAQGALLARGTASAPIIITSNAANPAPGDWQYIAIDGPGATTSALAYVQAFYGSWNGGDDGMLSVTGGAKPSISNSVFAQATDNGVWADDDSRPTISNCIFAGDATSAISVPADDATRISGTSVGPNQAGIEVRNTTITESGTWNRQNAPYIIDGGTVSASASISIAAGTVLEMASGAAFDVQGTLLVNGTANAPVIVTSTASQPKPGNWQYIAIDGPKASGSVLNYLQVFYGSWNGGDDGMISVTGGATPTISNSVFAQGTNHGVWADDGSRPTITNCAFVGDASSAISVPADDAALITGAAVGPGQVGIEVRNTNITHNGTWQQQSAPFVLDGAILNPNVTLTIAPGTLIQMASGAAFDAQGTLLANGTPTASIIVTSAANQPKPGDWQYITIDGTGATRSVISYVQVFYGSWNGGEDGMLSVTGGANPTINNSLFAQATSYGIWADDNSHPTISSCMFTNLGAAALSVPQSDKAHVSANAFGPGQKGPEIRS